MSAVRPSLDEVRTRVRLRRDDLEVAWPVWVPRTFGGHLDHCAQRWPDNTYFISRGVPWTYQQVAAYAHHAANSFYHAGIRRGDRVGVMLSNTAEFFAIKAALTHLNAIAINMNYLLSAAEVRYVMGHAQPRALVFDCEIAGRDMRQVLADAGALSAGADPALTLIVRDGDLGPAVPWASLHDFIASGVTASPAPDVSDPFAHSEIFYTAGSTGVPKAVLQYSDAHLRESYGTAFIRGLEPGWCSMTALPPFHLYGFAQCVLPPTFVGGAVLLQERFDAGVQLDILKQGQVTDIVAVAAMAYRIMDLVVADGCAGNVGALRTAYLGGDAVGEAQWQRIQDVLGVDEITSGFGMTEIQGTSFVAPPGSSNEVLANAIGWPTVTGRSGRPEYGGTKHEWRLVDLTSGAPVAAGEVGELQYRGPSVSPGYFKPPEGIPPRVDGWFSSGDTAWLRDDGALVFTGRNSEVFRSGGELVAPREVEAAIEELPFVSRAYVVGVPDQRWGQSGCAWVIPMPGAQVSVDAVFEHCRQNLARYKVPKVVYEMAEADVPMTGAGKVRKKSLADLANSRLAQDAEAAAVPDSS